MEHKSDYASTYQFLFADNPQDRQSCHYCVTIYVRTVNIIEKRECKSFFLAICICILLYNNFLTFPTCF